MNQLQSSSASKQTTPGRGRALSLLAALILIPAALIAYMSVTRRPESLAAGDRLQPFDARTLQGQALQVPASAPGGAQHVWLVVSASCPICRAELEEMQRSDEPFSRVTIVSLSSPEDTAAFMKSFPRLQGQTVVDAGGVLKRTYGNFRTPTGILMDDRGAIVRKWRGPRPSTVAHVFAQ